MTGSASPVFPRRSFIGLVALLLGFLWWVNQSGLDVSNSGAATFAAENENSKQNLSYPPIYRLNGYTMGTTYSLQSVGLPQKMSRDEFAADVDARLQRLDKVIFSTYQEDSELSRLNTTPVGQELEISSELAEVLLLSARISTLSEGAFDTTVGPLVNLWGFGPENRPEQGKKPAEDLIEERKSRVDYRHIEVDENLGTAARLADVSIDLSAIAKGYAVDQLALFFESQGLDNYFLEVGGELKMSGLKPVVEESGKMQWSSWVPAIERPVDSAPSIYQVLYSRGEAIALAGSGDYRNYFEVEGVRYSHEIDPRSGYPISHSLAAVYVIHESAASADALATAYMILGLDAGLKLAEEEDHAVFFISRSANNEVHGMQAGFSEQLTDEFSYYLSQ